MMGDFPFLFLHSTCGAWSSFFVCLVRNTAVRFRSVDDLKQHPLVLTIRRRSVREAGSLCLFRLRGNHV